MPCLSVSTLGLHSPVGLCTLSRCVYPKAAFHSALMYHVCVCLPLNSQIGLYSIVSGVGSHEGYTTCMNTQHSLTSLMAPDEMVTHRENASSMNMLVVICLHSGGILF